MFDFAAAGPLLGVLGSVGAILIGSQLTMVSDPSSLPALPVEVLRQSTLGGGLINAVMGNGALTVPEGALGTQAVAAMTIPLHPVALAGYISLVVNALALLPVGSTYLPPLVTLSVLLLRVRRRFSQAHSFLPP